MVKIGLSFSTISPRRNVPERFFSNNTNNRKIIAIVPQRVKPLSSDASRRQVWKLRDFRYERART